MAVIAMTREMATLGRDVAAGLAERLGLVVVHHELVAQDIAERSGMRESEVQRFLEGEASLLQRWRIDRNRMSRYTSEEILELAVKGNVLIRGWGATYLLRSVPHVLCVRICAPMPNREDVLMQRLGLQDRAAARREIERNDAAHNGTMQRLFGIDWTDPALYALVLNTARIPVADCVEHIVNIAQSAPFQETPASRQALSDQLTLSKVHTALDKRFGSSSSALGIDAEVSEGKVILKGALSDEKMITEAVRLMHNVPGVTRVESRIGHLAFSRD
ncbi:MAG: cytidylate kinase family protein [Hyphomicrobiaceae bacterium]